MRLELLFPFVWAIQKLCNYFFHFTGPNWIFGFDCVVSLIFTLILDAKHEHSPTYQILYISRCSLYLSFIYLNQYMCILCIYIYIAHTVTFYTTSYICLASILSWIMRVWLRANEMLNTFYTFHSLKLNVFASLLLVSSFVSVYLHESVLILSYVFSVISSELILLLHTFTGNFYILFLYILKLFEANVFCLTTFVWFQVNSFYSCTHLQKEQSP